MSYKITKESKKDIEPVEDLKKIEKASGATLYFDRGLFQSTKQKKIFYRVFTVAGQTSFLPLRSKIFQGTDAVILVVDSQTKFLEDNVQSLLELKNVAHDKLRRRPRGRARAGSARRSRRWPGWPGGRPWR